MRQPSLADTRSTSDSPDKPPNAHTYPTDSILETPQTGSSKGKPRSSRHGVKAVALIGFTYPPSENPFGAEAEKIPHRLHMTA